MKFFVDAETHEYLGGFLGCEPDIPAIEVPERPHTDYKWQNSEWVKVDPTPPTREEQERNRQAAFQREADPLFFKWQAGEGDDADWLAKREEIRARYPYPEPPE